MIRKLGIVTLILSLSIPSVTPLLAADTPATATASAAKARVGVIKLRQALVERPASFSLSLASLNSDGKPPALSDLITSLNQAAKDPALSGLFLDLSDFSLTLSQAQELGGLLTNVRKTGKRIAIYSASFDTNTYALATYADTIIMPENGDIMIPGVGLQMLFFAGTLEKLNMSADFVQVGKFKGAEEPFTRKTASPEYREQIEKLVDGMYKELVSTLAANRPNLTEDQIKKAIDESWFTGKHARERGLIDQTTNRENVEPWIKSQFPAGVTFVDDYGSPKKQALNLDSPFAIFSLLGDKPKAVSRDPAIAVIYANGEILGDTAGQDDSTEVVTPALMRKAVKAALEDDHVKAIVLRVDSPGGSAAASDEIWSLLKAADKKKPVTVSMGRVAASGGYYISCSGRSIMADPSSITGSIGVVSGKLVIKDALNWAGINIEPVVRGEHAEMLSMLRPFSDDERVFMRKMSEEIYGIFTSRVTAARGDKVSKIEDVAQGRLFTGTQAKTVGLVDDVGTLNDAVKAAAKTAGIADRYQVITLPEAKSLSDILRDGLLADVKTPITLGLKLDAATALLSTLPAEIREPAARAMRLLQTLQNERLLMALPPGLVETAAHH